MVWKKRRAANRDGLEEKDAGSYEELVQAWQAASLSFLEQGKASARKICQKIKVRGRIREADAPISFFESKARWSRRKTR
jgi:hypothetical protein